MSASLALPHRGQQRFLLNGLALLFVALAVAGGLRAYSPIPVWDMWSAYLSFMDQAAEGGWRTWWGQHNEHRLLLARLFFWVDLRWFDGAGWFLIAVNYLLAALAAWLFCRILRHVEVAPERRAEMHALYVLVIIALFFWSQQDNLTGGFQSQFFLAQLIPLAALYALYRSLPGGRAAFSLACLLGVLSAGSMANGVLALPLMTAYAALTRQGARRIGTLALLTALTLYAYFYDYAAPAHHSSPLQALREHPLQVVRYVLYYLGSPFYHAFGGKGPGRSIALIAAVFLVGSALRFALQALRRRNQSALPLALLFYIAYIGATAFGTAAGRLLFGVSQSLTLRYSTPALMAWCALLVLYAPALLALEGRRRRLVWAGLALTVALMLVYQTKALNSLADELFKRSIGALAIELRIKDEVELSHMYPTTDVVEITAPAADRQRSVFGMFPFKGARAQMGATFAPVALPACQGMLETAESTAGDARFLRVAGWMYGASGKREAQVVRFLDSGGRQVGYALGGQVRADLRAQIAQAADGAGFRGYLSAAEAGPELTLRGEGPDGPFCQMRVAYPAPAPGLARDGSG